MGNSNCGIAIIDLKKNDGIGIDRFGIGIDQFDVELELTKWT